MIILDLGNGDAHHNDRDCIAETIDSIADITKDVILKFQLFGSFGGKMQMRPDIWDYAYNYCDRAGFRVTASVFDGDSYDLLLRYSVPFIKVANKDYLRRMFAPNPDYLFSVDNSPRFVGYHFLGCKVLCCISNYPATAAQYEAVFDDWQLVKGISDHTGTCELFAKYQPAIYEAHYILKKYDDKDREYCLNSQGLTELTSLVGNDRLYDRGEK